MTEDKFANDEDYQQKVLAYALYDDEFRGISGTALTPEDWANKPLQWYFETISKSPVPLTPFTLKEELVKAVKAKKVREEEIDKYVEAFQVISKRPTPPEEEYIRTDLSRFMKTQAMKRAILNSFDLIEKGDWDTIISDVTEATKVGMDITSIGQDYFGEYIERIARRTAGTSSSKFPTGITEVDDILTGGPEQKQLALVAGGTGRGKSIFLEWVGRTAILLGKTVVYYTLEIPEDKIGARYDSLFSRVKIKEIKHFPHEVENALLGYSTKYKGKLIIKEYPADSATVHTIRAHIRQLHSSGIVPDMVIVDYLDLLKPHRNYSSMYEELDSITKALHGLAKELNVCVWTATQLNRSGITAENPDETAISGSLAKLYTVDIALFLAQTNEEREDEQMRIIVSKNREGLTGRTIKIDTDYAYMTFLRSSLAGIT